jgi:hypothetical protein
MGVVMSIVTVGKPLREKLGDEAVESLIELINQSLSEQKNDILEFVEEKFERRLTEEISKLKGTLLEKISEMDNRLSEKMSDLIKWMFIFWVGQVGVILGILFAFFK